MMRRFYLDGSMRRSVKISMKLDPDQVDSIFSAFFGDLPVGEDFVRSGPPAGSVPLIEFVDGVVDAALEDVWTFGAVYPETGADVYWYRLRSAAGEPRGVVRSTEAVVLRLLEEAEDAAWFVGRVPMEKEREPVLVLYTRKDPQDPLVPYLRSRLGYREASE